MSLALHSNLFEFSPSRITLNLSSHTTSVVQKNPRFSLLIASRYLSDPLHFHISSKQKLHCPFNFISLRSNPSRVKVLDSEGVAQREDDFNLDFFLSFSEFLCLASSTVISIVFAVTRSIPKSKKALSVVIGDRFIVWGIVLLVAGVALGAWIRRRQWRRICGQTVKGALEVNLLERIEKLEQDLKTSATIVRVLSRQLEKLGIRFRVTRKALKEPIAETAALAQKNSVATQALAEHEDILEKELGEIQKVLLAMQEQQRKQLELIVAIGKSGKLLESRQELNQTQISNEKRGAGQEALRPKEAHQI